MTGILEAISVGVVANTTKALAARIYSYLAADIARNFQVRSAILRKSFEKKSLNDVIGEAVHIGFAQSGLLNGVSEPAIKTVIASPVILSHALDGIRLQKT
ncbi:hypothetical protein NKI80_05075 [Mesorhizobium sp. M0387]|uniref:hypothetical protein n=1 Tax=Mesorhizobium sp. M0387 TaxID=2956940 RepID=UPI0033385CF6